MRTLLLLLCIAQTLSCDRHHDHHDHSNLTTSRELVGGVGRCGTLHSSLDDEIAMAKAHSDWSQRNSGRRLQNKKKIIVDTYFHILLGDDVNGETVGDFPNDMVEQAIFQLNRAFKRNTPFEYKLKKTTRTKNQLWHEMKFNNYETELAYKSALRTKGTNVLNVYMGDALRGQGIWGWAWYPPGAIQDPEFDGVVVANPLIRDKEPVDAYMTLVHEVRIVAFCMSNLAHLTPV
jgi:hypothetical protein